MSVASMDEGRNISEMVQNSMGQSVTPSRLKDSKVPGFFDRLLGYDKIEGPFHQDLYPDESPHYVFRDGTDLSMPEEEDGHSDSHFSILGTSILPTVVLVTDVRTILFHTDESKTERISVKHEDVVSLEINDGTLVSDMTLTTTQRTIQITLTIGSSYASELADAAAYIADQAGIEKETTGSDFDAGSVDSAKEEFINQLSKIDGLREELDLLKVADEAAAGAELGIRRGKITTALGIVLFGGIEIWDQLSESDNDEVSPRDLDPEETADEIVRWQKLGKSSDRNGMELATGAIGAAISVDKQTSGRAVSKTLSNLGEDWIDNQLEDKNKDQAAIELASDAVKAYSEEISWLSEQEGSDTDIDT